MDRRSIYVLITVIEREIETEIFETYDSAREKMFEEMSNFGYVPDEIFEHDEYEDPSGDFGFSKYGGWSNVGYNNDSYDWSIICITEKGVA